MKLITRDTDYAIRALSFFCSSGRGIISVLELAEALKIPRAFLRKILQTLSREGVLESIKGQGGGFTLSIKAQDIFLLDLIRIFQGSLEINECFMKKLPCPNKRSCILRKKIEAVKKNIVRELGSITLQSLLKGG